MRVISRTYSRISGFTLVEILVALMLFSLILVMVFNAMYSAGLSWQKGEAQSHLNDFQRLDLAFLHRQLSEAVPLIQIDGIRNRVMFMGGSDSLRFVSDLPAHSGGGGLSMIDVRMEQHGSGNNLVMAYQHITPGIEFFEDVDKKDIKKLVLLPDIIGIEISYYGDPEANGKPGWHHDWVSNDRLPDLIRMHIIKGKSQLYRPEIVIPVHMQVLRGQPQLTLDTRQTIDGTR